MKIASSSAAFARAFVAREITQLEWLDIAANELEVDAVVFAGEHFARTDSEHCAQLKKVATDLGLSVAAWSTFVDRLKARAKEAKRANVTLALRNVPSTIIASIDDAKRVAKDVDSAWLRFEIDISGAGTHGNVASALDEAVIAAYGIATIARFATDADADAPALIRELKRFRGCVVLEVGDVRERSAYHDALARFAVLRASALAVTV
jgi:hypothetical protein